MSKQNAASMDTMKNFVNNSTKDDTIPCPDCGWLFACPECSKIYDRIDQELDHLRR